MLNIGDRVEWTGSWGGNMRGKIANIYDPMYLIECDSGGLYMIDKARVSLLLPTVAGPDAPQPTVTLPDVPSPTCNVIRPKCPACGTAHERNYVGFSSIECANPDCPYYSATV